MTHINMATIDLNLLRTFVAIWEHRSLTIAAERLHLSQPAVSHALRRLRDVFDDPLFVRTAMSMEPTDAAIRLHVPIENALTIIQNALMMFSNFESKTANRTFRISMSDMSQLYVLPRVMEVLAYEAPNVRLDVLQMPLEQLSMALRKGDIDIAVGYLVEPTEECIYESLLDDEFICLLRKDHPFQESELNIQDIRALRYVDVSSNITGHGMTADAAFKKAGIPREITLKVPNFTIAPKIVANTDLALILPRSIAAQLNHDHRYRLLNLPIELPSISVGLYCHSRFLSDAGINWLRGLLISRFAADILTGIHVNDPCGNA
ncbi:PCP degradation transcriptional activation protein [Pseudomonas sp. Bi70]|uniref:LysR family transcriptional regulator n=1 Tax=Pseudomonas sp. Bi70 TaxID=2821127 RepID=UPI001E0D3E1D|nr:LysR family transcriptional regulator [Pseudomonas sp. Bi70]CAH0144455.1 PCP degradation transcriptional activation protein [Pseudomonas sp. Bi70]